MPRVTSHPGEILQEEFLAPLGLSARALAAAIEVPPNRISEIVRGRRDVSADTAIRLGRYFGTDPRFWQVSDRIHDHWQASNPVAYGVLDYSRLDNE